MTIYKLYNNNSAEYDYNDGDDSNDSDESDEQDYDDKK